ncbi:Eco57I restriction-modification methylase domain-containing protein [Leyella lascolaii]|uniref:site-specific DNA-methyltransferase (adenine-specific) n=1 Tax=Leyella lascolaii TaxID=1776379 RepID=A0AAW7JRH0_9BACT|nr:TaqI-like C-terminal specificity domain-containing protein [Leyella lascolaii]MDN0022156.1 TaqI-like C-terminal specificity domain-containing protein [Leyella lascolaii]MDN0024451.1 TaqI-like C-terminal specificity domain-containing protein [Leyella lascolaii]
MSTYTDTQLRNIFQSPFNPNEWQDLLQNFFSATELRHTPERLDTPDIGQGYYLGHIDTSDSYRIGLFRYDIAKGSVANKRVGLRNLVKSFINPRLGEFDAALAVFDSGDHWRLSFICDIKGEATSPKRYTYVFGDNHNLYRTPIERFVKLKSNGVTFANLIEAFSVEALSKDFYNKLYLWYQWALSPEAGVTFPNNPETEKDDRENLHVKLIRLITRMLFVWFIKQKHLVPNNIFDARALKNILVDFDEKSFENGNYYNAILQNLFFATLNCAIIDEDGNQRRFANASARDTRNLYRYAEMFNMSEQEVIHLFSYIPFLNGGLFDCLDKPKGLYIDLEHDILYDGFSRNAARSSNGNYKYRAFIPNVLFFNDDEQQPGLITLFNQYNFTIEENSPTDAEISLDPELLGRVFENLLAAYNPETQESARKSTGSFYTPREIVDYMVDESLKNYLLGTGIRGLNENMLDALFHTHTIKSEWNKEIVESVTDALKRVKILDPACGSGAFPMGCMLRIVDIVELLHNDEIDRYQLKLDIIENCVFGVDIQPIAMLICKLRFFISLVCEQKDIDFNDPAHNYGINTLPNLETKFVAANTLLSAEIRNFDKDWTADDELRNLQEQLLTIRNHHLLAKGRKAKRQCQREDKAKRAEILQYIVDHAQKPDEQRIAEWKEQIKTLKIQLEQYKEEVWIDETRPIENTLFGPVQTPQALFRKDLNKVKRNELLKCIQAIENSIKKEQRKAEINGFEAAVKEITKWDPYNQNAVADFFDPEWMFGVSDGFDIVIGNPPYLRIQELRKANNELADYLSKMYKSATGSFDLYVTFVERGLNLIKSTGVIYYIMPVKWTNSSFGKGLRNLCYEKSCISSIINFVAYQVFEASTYTGIHCFKKAEKLSYLELDRDMKNNHELHEFLKSITPNDFVDIKIRNSDPWILTNKSVNKVLEKLNQCPYRLSDIFEKIFQGIATSKDDVYFLYDCHIINSKEIEGYSKYLQRRIVIENGLVKPLLKGEDVHRYMPLSSDKFVIFPYDISTGKAELFSESQISTLFPKGYSYLKECETELRGREKGRFDNDKWYMFGRGQGINYGGVPKLLAPEISLGGNFSYDKKGHFYSTTTVYGYIRKENIKITYETLLAIMNSRLCWWFLKNTGTVLANGYFRYKPAYLFPFPIPSIEEAEERKIQENVNKLMYSKDEERSLLVKNIDLHIYSLYGLTQDEIKQVSND